MEMVDVDASNFPADSHQSGGGHLAWACFHWMNWVNSTVAYVDDITMHVIIGYYYY